MATPLTSSLRFEPELLPIREALSGIAGSISLAAWIFLLVPQVIENYKNGNAEGVSVAFITIWLFGDVANLIGALWGHLLPTMIVLAVYFCFSDFVLLSQTIFYNHVTKLLATRRERQRESTVANADDPTQPLFTRRRSSSAKSRQRRSSAKSPDSLSAILVEDNATNSEIVKNTLGVLGVCLAGVLGWVIAWKSGAWVITPPGQDKPSMPRGAEFLGYLSAVLYLGARIPQIIRNYTKKSCEGLSLLFFLLSLLGNFSYGAGILLHCTDIEYIKDNLPWLIGSLGTIFEDAIIFTQFQVYSRRPREPSDVESAVI